MWLDIRQTATVGILGEEQLVVPTVADVVALVEEPSPGEPEFYRVGRILADRLDIRRIAELGIRVWDVADADSSGLEAAWASLLDEGGERDDVEIQVGSDPVVYLYRFVLHPDYAEWRMAVMDLFCHNFGANAQVLVQHHTTLFSETEFDALGFRLLPPTRFPAPPGYPDIDRQTRFWARENRLGAEYGFSDYPEEAPPSQPKHEAWVQEECPDTRLT